MDINEMGASLESLCSDWYKLNEGRYDLVRQLFLTYPNIEDKYITAAIKKATDLYGIKKESRDSLLQVAHYLLRQRPKLVTNHLERVFLRAAKNNDKTTICQLI